MAKKKGSVNKVIRAANAVFYLYLALLIWVAYGNLPTVFEDIIVVLMPIFLLARVVSLETNFRSPVRRIFIGLLTILSVVCSFGFLYLVLTY